jgi:NhaP-type Na+/H+ or K+/H+ antiporter
MFYSLVVALIVGVVLGPHGANWIRPINYAQGDVNGDGEKLEAVTLAFSRLVLGVQLVLAGVQLPKKYLIHEWKSLGMLLGPVMVTKWVVTACLVWLLIPKASFVSFFSLEEFIASLPPTSGVVVEECVGSCTRNRGMRHADGSDSGKQHRQGPVCGRPHPAESSENYHG